MNDFDSNETHIVSFSFKTQNDNFKEVFHKVIQYNVRQTNIMPFVVLTPLILNRLKIKISLNIHEITLKSIQKL